MRQDLASHIRGRHGYATDPLGVARRRLGRDAGRVAQEVVAHLNALVGTEAEVTIEVRATNDDGFPDTVVKIVSENASALRFEEHGFEAG